MTLGVVHGGTKFQDPKTGIAAFYFDSLDLDAQPLTARRIPLTFLAHGFTTHPLHPHLAAVFEKRGPGAALLDLREGRVVREIAPSENSYFYGHGAFSSSGEHLYIVETELAEFAGRITVRETDTMQVIDTFPTYGENPHDCILSADGRTLTITNGGGELGSAFAPSVTVVDIETKELIEKVTFSDPKINAGHIAIGAAGFAVSSAPRDGLPTSNVGGLTLRRGKRKPERVKKPSAVTDRMIGEALSVAFHEPSDTVVVTSPAGDMVTFWNFAAGTLREKKDLAFPRGVALTLGGDRYILTHGKNATLGLYDANSLALIESSEFPTGLFSGSHIYVRSRR